MIRPQGSSYILDLTGADTVFYQLDGWHEWKAPSRWCEDFAIEAELHDSTFGSPSIHTERPAGVDPGDYTNFTSYLRFSGIGQSATYHFHGRTPAQTALHFWVRARSSDMLPASLNTRVDGGSASTIINISGTWDWYRISSTGDSIRFSGLDTTLHQVDINALSANLEIDRILLKRSDEDFTIATFSISASADTVCFMDTTQFNLSATTPAGCIDYFWDFGDGMFSYEENPGHLYQKPGAYTATVRVHETCSDQSDTDTIIVLIDAPIVEAGVDTFVCQNGQVQLSGQSSAPFSWAANPSLSSTAILNPIATIANTDKFYLTGTDSAGCTLTDSTLVTSIAMQVVWDSIVDGCLGGPVQLQVTGGFQTQWSSDSTLSDTTIWNPVATPPAAGHTYFFQTWDACGCDTVNGSITIRIDTNAQIVTPDTALCHAQALTIQASNGSAYLWSTGDNTASTTVVATMPDTVSVLITDSIGCNVRDTVFLALDSACCTVDSADFVLVRERASNFYNMQNLPFDGLRLHIADTFWVDTTITFSNSAFFMDSAAVILIEAGDSLSTSTSKFSSACGDYMWNGIVSEGLNARYASAQDTFRDAESAIISNNGGDFSVDSCVFLDNYRGVLLNPYVGTHTGTILSSTFRFTGNMIPPHTQDTAPRAGIEVIDVAEFVLGDTLAAHENTFDSLVHGVYFRNLNSLSGQLQSGRLEVINAAFRNMVPDSSDAKPWATGAGIRSEAFQGLIYTPELVVGLENGSTVSELNAAACTFNNSVHGVYIDRLCDAWYVAMRLAIFPLGRFRFTEVLLPTRTCRTTICQGLKSAYI